MSISIPEISRDSRFLMSSYSYFKLSVEKATAMEMARGKPSGTQTIRRAIAIVTF
jgi:hypothetical protein